MYINAHTFIFWRFRYGKEIQCNGRWWAEDSCVPRSRSCLAWLAPWAHWPHLEGCKCTVCHPCHDCVTVDGICVGLYCTTDQRTIGVFSIPPFRSEVVHHWTGSFSLFFYWLLHGMFSCSVDRSHVHEPWRKSCWSPHIQKNYYRLVTIKTPNWNLLHTHTDTGLAPSIYLKYCTWWWTLDLKDSSTDNTLNTVYCAGQALSTNLGWVRVGIVNSH